MPSHVSIFGKGPHNRRRGLKTLILALVWSSLPTYVFGQNVNALINMIQDVRRAAIAERSRMAWSKIPPNEQACLQKNLQQIGQSIPSLIQRGVMPTDASLVSIRSGCKNPVTVSPPETPSGGKFESARYLSNTPTFDCTTAKSGSGRIICLDREGALADWELASAFQARLFSIPEAGRDKFSKDHDQWFPMLNKSCKLYISQTSFSVQQRDCVLTGFRKRAALYRSRLNGNALREARLSPGEHAGIQSALIARGFLKGDADGEFGNLTRQAIRAFAVANGEPESDYLTAELHAKLLQQPQAAPASDRNRITQSSAPDLRNQPVPPTTMRSSISSDVLERSQRERDLLFKNLQAGTKYTFQYVVINLPPGTVPGVSVPIPVSHIRYDSTVFFAFDRFVLESSGQSVVADFATTILKDKSYQSVLVVGHTDSIGTEEYNYNLSRNRAATVSVALRAAGVTDKFLGVVPMGKAQPIATNSTPQGRASNRRVEFFISDVPEATRVAIERTTFNPCYINDQEGSGDCSAAPARIPILPYSGEGPAIAVLDLSRSALPVGRNVSRPSLPIEILKRPSIGDLQITE